VGESVPERSGAEPPSWRIDDLAHKAGLTVDTIRFYQREGLLPPAERAGRAKLYGPDHLARLEQIRELQGRRFSLAAIRSLLATDRADLIEGIFSGEGALSYSREELVERSGLDPDLVDRLHDVGLLRDPVEFGRDAYDSTDVDLLRTAAELVRVGIPDDLLVELVGIYVRGVEAMQQEVLALFRGETGPMRDQEVLHEFQARAAGAAGRLLPLVSRIVEYVHQRTLQRLTLRAIEAEASPTDP
jgi:DNA-binding transcriptional MerR regulator